MTRSEARTKYSECFIGNKLDVNANLINGESIEDVKTRIMPLVDLLVPFKDSPNNCLICSHNQKLKVLYATLFNIPITNFLGNI